MDPRWPLGIASLALAVAGLLASRVEPLRANASSIDAASIAWRPVLLLAAIAWIAAFGMQLHTSFGSALAPAVAARIWWVPVFWIGFAVGLIVAARTNGSVHAMRWCATSLVIGAVSFWAASRAGGTAAFVTAQCLAGATWAIVLTTVLANALRFGGPKGLASPLGVLMSAISLAALSRLLCVAFGLQRITDWTFWALALWLIAAGGALCVRQRPQAADAVA